MNMVEVLMLVAAWCGTPVPYKLDTAQVNACREKVISCINKQWTNTEVVLSCMKETKIGG